jgi:hypothetical protein
MAVRSDAYQKQNGMNKRKAGEDFYFLQKLIPLGNFTVLKTTKIIPSPRVSDRVPFGTGRAMQSWLAAAERDCELLSEKVDGGKGHDNKGQLFSKGGTEGGIQELLSYHPQSFRDLKVFADAVPKLYVGETAFPVSVQGFLYRIDFEGNLVKIKKNSKSSAHFCEVFFKWFNAFKVLKFMHFARDNYYPAIAVFDGANELLVLNSDLRHPDLKGLLEKYRCIDRV